MLDSINTVESSPGAKNNNENNTNTCGCTLSSDLLCLASCSCRGLVDAAKDDAASAADRTGFTVLAAGGVDGRIHFWDESFRKKTETNAKSSKISNDDGDESMAPVVVAAHNGRVNALQFFRLDDDHASGLLSVSHDGTIQCWSLSVAKNVGKAPSLLVKNVASWHLDRDEESTGDGNPPRITALA